MSRVVMMFLLLVGGEALTCEPGKGGIDSCVECEPGRFNDKHRLAECDKCPKGRFAEFSGSLTCELCPGGKHESRVVTAQSGGHWPRRVGPAPAIDSGGRSREGPRPALLWRLVRPHRFNAFLGWTKCDDCNAWNAFMEKGEGFYSDVLSPAGAEHQEECECIEGYSGQFCNVQVCPEVHPANSLGSMILMASPLTRKAIGGDAGEDEVTLTANARNALQECDLNSDNVLTIAEAIECLANYHVIVEPNRFVKIKIDSSDAGPREDPRFPSTCLQK